MTTLLETPMPIILFGIVAEAVLGILLLRTGRGVLLAAMLGVLVLVLAGVGLEWLVVTETERIEQTLFEAAAAVEANRQEDVLRLIDPANTESQRLIRWALGRFTFTKAKITHLEVKNINRLTSPPTAEVELVGSVSVRGGPSDIPYESRPIKFDVKLRRQQDRWVISGHVWHDAPGIR
ncbi:MAG: hypothetical protein JXB62_19110 [Pirellulales bacterium]|nr:hypothetical protein [Pirellulales bacterium]